MKCSKLTLGRVIDWGVCVYCHDITLVLPCHSDLDIENCIQAIIRKKVRSRKLILGRDIGCGVFLQHNGVTLI